MDLSLKTTTFGGQISFIDSDKVRYVRGGVTLDAAAVTADPVTGIKKLLAGAFIGKQGNGKWARYVAGGAAFLITGVVGNNNAIRFTAKAVGADGNTIRVQLRNPGIASQALRVFTENDTVVVSLATDGASAITSTAASVITAINSALYVKDILIAANEGASTGAGVVVAVAATALAGGTAPNVTPTLLLAEEVTFTSYAASGGLSHADRVATAIDWARVITSRLPAAPDTTVRTNMPSITFAS